MPRLNPIYHPQQSKRVLFLFFVPADPFLYSITLHKGGCTAFEICAHSGLICTTYTIPMVNDNDDKVLTEFSMERVLEMPRGVVQNYRSPLKDRKGKINIVVTDTMGIVDGTMVADKHTQSLTHYNDRPFVEMNFMLEGNIRQNYEGILRQHHYRKGYNNILFSPYSTESNELMTAGLHRMFTIHVLPERMAELFACYLPDLQPFAEKIIKEEAFVLHAPANSIDNKLRYLFDTFWECPALPALGKLYFESKMLELLCRQCELLIKPAAIQTGITKTELEKLYHAKDILINNLYAPPSLQQLSASCGLNEFRLKKYFKEVFHQSVYNFVCEERLRRARQMIFEGEKNISSIAYELGYAHPQHFHRAFKKQFGVTPKSLLK
jgi:AraC family transcriptional regulator, transcriptional activator of the genes for pyochelin and ferripyochelin receptors